MFSSVDHIFKTYLRYLVIVIFVVLLSKRAEWNIEVTIFLAVCLHRIPSNCHSKCISLPQAIPFHLITDR